MSKHHTKNISSDHFRFLSLGRNFKKAIMVVADMIVLPLALWSAFALRLAEWWPEKYLSEAWVLFLILPIIGVLIFTKLGLYRAIVRFMGSQAILSVCKGVLALAALLWIAATLFEIRPFPRSVPINFAFVALVYVGGSRFLVRSFYHWRLHYYVEKEAVLVYGAGASGIQLVTALDNGADYLPVGFLDDDQSLWKSTVNGLPIYDPSKLEELINEQEVGSVLLAMPSISRANRRKILESLSDLTVHVKTVPNMSELVSGESLSSLRDPEIEDLLGRDVVPADPALLGKSISGKAVMVTGAGGSIGSEICRQIMQNKPKVLVLYEISEFALYSIENELQETLSSLCEKISIYAVLGNIQDRVRVDKTLEHFGIDTIYHAAAYKHVPMVEHNIIEGIRNNSIGTLVLAEAAQRQQVERFVLISTDKAVRPTNVMGATKRLAELILQDCAQRETKTIFAMVRFGNVLGSSGSVVPLFRKQINEGGPVTVTHPEITRFFMTIPEAASLVIQAGSMAEGGDVFVLDMGQPVKISELATRMIKLMGEQVQTPENPNGIEISFSGLRPGEKLYEELLIGDDVVGTGHQKIMRAEEEMISHNELKTCLDRLLESIELGDSQLARETLEHVITGFSPSSPLVDWFHSENGDNKTLQ